MHGRTLATTESVIAVVSPAGSDASERLRDWCHANDLDFEAVPVGDDVGEVYDPDSTTLGVAIGGDGTFLEAIQGFAPREVPVLGINTGTLAFLTRVSPSDLHGALTEVLRGRATVAERQQFEVGAEDLDATGINDVILRAVPPEDPTGRKITGIHVYVDDEYAGRYDGTGVVVSTPTGSTGISLSANGPIHYPEDNFTLQVVPLSTHRMGVRPVVVGADSTIRIVPEDEVDLLVDGGRAHVRLDPYEVVSVTGEDAFAQLVRTSFDDDFFASMAEKLGWGIRDPAEEPEWVSPLSPEPSEEDFLERARRVAIEAAESAGEPLRDLHGRVESVEFKTSKSDIVTEADYRAERIITTAIENEFPDHNVRSEEKVQREHGSQYTWLVDPLDGTGNFAHGNPNYSVSIALLEGERPVMGVVYNPETRETFTAIEGRDATEDGKVISTTDRDRLDESMLLSGYDPDGSFLVRFYQATRGVRRLGSAALNLCYLASGSADAIWEYDTHPWDVAAGLVIARAAGATVTDSVGDPYELRLDDTDRRELLGTNGPLQDAVLSRLQSADPDLDLGRDPDDA